MMRSIKVLTVESLAALVLALCMLTLAPVASTSLKGAGPVDASVANSSRGGMSVVYKNGATPLWMAKLMSQSNEGIWL